MALTPETFSHCHWIILIQNNKGTIARILGVKTCLDLAE